MSNQEPALDPNWCVIEKEFKIETNRHYESLFALGTGFLTTRASIEEGFEDDDQGMEFNRFAGVVTLEAIPAGKSKWGTYTHSVAARHPFLCVGVANLPYYLGLVVKANGEKLDLERSKVTDYCRWLDLKTATLHRRLVWHTNSGCRIQLVFQRFMDPQLKFTCVQTCAITMLAGDAKLEVSHYVDNNVRTNGYDKYTAHAVGIDDDGVIHADVTTNHDNRVVTASRAVVDKTSDWNIDRAARRITATASFTLAKGESAQVKKVSAVISDVHFERQGLLNDARELVQRVIALEAKTLHAQHKSAWTQRWATCDIEIEANDHPGYDSQLGIRQAIYHLLRSRHEDDERGQVCPKCCTSDVYFGGTFWDMEIFILPFYLYTNPKAARGTTMFRYHNLPGARAIAEKQGYIGARYPWTSAADGSETCPLWEFSDHQVHITADVAIGAWHYYLTSGDQETLFNHGAEIIIDTARYWTQRVDKIPGKDGYQIFGVMGPDEYKVITNNNAYTNHLAKFALDIAAQTIELMQEQAPDKFRELAERLELEGNETQLFREIAEGIPIPVDAERNIVWQCDGFDTEFTPLDIKARWQDRTRPFGAFVSQEERFRSKAMKQSDTVALFMILPEDFSIEQRKASFEYYDPICSHDSSNSMCSRMIAAANVGWADLAYDSWKQSLDIDFGVRPRSSDGLHGANVGGMWQEAVCGFGGLISALNTDVLTFKPCLPQEIARLSFKIQWKGQWVKATMTADEARIENLSDDELTCRVFAKEETIPAGKEVRIGY
ncbi:glycosyl hydrolase family 65 protein [Candidatus Sumerlaeota bacterium]